MDATRIRELSGRRVDELSGGQRQRVWMALAQQTPILLLDEPTTFLDVSYQIELLELCRKLNHEREYTLVAVLHDLNQAARYADHIIVMKGGEVLATGNPTDVITEELVRAVLVWILKVIADPESGGRFYPVPCPCLSYDFHSPSNCRGAILHEIGNPSSTIAYGVLIH